MVIPELIRLLTDRGLSMDEAIDQVSRTCAYTNHTILAEALEKWPLSFLQDVAPQLVPIIQELDRRVREDHPDPRVAILDSQGLVHMAHMDIHYLSLIHIFPPQMPPWAISPQSGKATSGSPVFAFSYDYSLRSFSIWPLSGSLLTLGGQGGTAIPTAARGRPGRDVYKRQVRLLAHGLTMPVSRRWWFPLLSWRTRRPAPRTLAVPVGPIHLRTMYGMTYPPL